MDKTIALLGAFDTKGAEYGFVRDYIRGRGLRTLTIDVGVLGEPSVEPDITRDQIAGEAGTTIRELAEAGDRGRAVAAMSRGAASLATKLFVQGRFDAMLALGGTGGTSLATAVMRELPVGVPKVMVSTVASGDVSGYVGVKDIVMIPSIVDVSGINRISRTVLTQAAAAVCGMAAAVVPPGEDRPLIAASMFGNTTSAVERAKSLLERQGYEVLVFHCTGVGGRTMESLIESGCIAGVLDITTTEWADEVAGGVFSAGPDRLGAAARQGVPAIVVPGCLDMVNFGAPETVPSRFAGRNFYRHNANVTLMRTTPEENRQMGSRMAEQLNRSRRVPTVLFPLRGLSVISAAGGPFCDPDADRALLQTLRERLRPDIRLIELDCPVNDPAFADRCVDELLANMQAAT